MHAVNLFKIDSPPKLRRVVSSLPVINQKSLEYLLRFFKKLVDKSDSNKMTVGNVGIVFGPTIFRCLADSQDPSASMIETMQCTECVCNLINNFNQAFGQRSSVMLLNENNAQQPQAATLKELVDDSVKKVLFGLPGNVDKPTVSSDLEHVKNIDRVQVNIIDSQVFVIIKFRS